MREWCVALLLIAAVMSACAGSDDAGESPSAGISADGLGDTEPGDAVIETRSEIGPSALDADQSMMMVVDSLDVTGGDVFVRVRVVNGSEQFLNVEAEGNLYGPLLVIRDDRGTTYPARAVEPAGVDAYTVGRMRFRVDGPFDPDAEQFTVEIATSRGPLATEPTATPDGDGVRWLTESPPMVLSDVAVSGRGDRTVHVSEIVDRGTHLDVVVQAQDASAGLSIPDDVTAMLTLDDGTELESLPLARPASRQSNEYTGVLRFMGTLRSGSAALLLTIAGIDVEIPLGRAATGPAQPASTGEAPFADPPRLPDLLHFDVHPEPLPKTTITI